MVAGDMSLSDVRASFLTGNSLLKEWFRREENNGIKRGAPVHF